MELNKRIEDLPNGTPMAYGKWISDYFCRHMDAEFTSDDLKRLIVRIEYAEMIVLKARKLKGLGAIAIKKVAKEYCEKYGLDTLEQEKQNEKNTTA